MAMIDDITTTECGVYTITNNGTTTPNILNIKKFVNNVENVYEFEDVTTVEVTDTVPFNFTIDEIAIYSFSWETDVSDVAIVVNTCGIDVCLLQYINKLVCCNDCLACDTTCEGTEWLGKYIATDTLYVLLIDLLTSHFGGTDMIYEYITDMYDNTHTLAELMDKLENLCSCTTC